MIDLLYYDFGSEVEAFSTRKGSDLPFHVIQPHQTHEDKVVIITDPTTDRPQLEGVDALVTNLVDCPIGVRTADCVPILLFDPVQKVVAAVHSGWRGTVKKIVQTSVNKMVEAFGTSSRDLITTIGPSIGPASFSVHQDVFDAFDAASFPMDAICKRIDEETYLINLWETNRLLMLESGLQPQNIRIAGICTYINHDEFYSARYEKNIKCGRIINVIKLLK